MTDEQNAVVVPLEPDHIPEDLKCSICFGVPLTPALTPCQHVFCRFCVEQALQEYPHCPICREGCTTTSLRSLTHGSLVYRIWSAIPVKCARHEEGCAWTGTISDASNHAQKCQFNEGGASRVEIELLRQRNADLEETVKDLRNIVANKNERILEERLKFASLESQYKALSAKLNAKPKVLQQDKVFNGTYSFNRDNVVELSKLISRHLEDKPDEIDRNRIYNCVRNCYNDLKKEWTDNPEHYYIDVRMLLTTCAASTWFTTNQYNNIRDWLHAEGWN